MIEINLLGATKTKGSSKAHKNININFFVLVAGVIIVLEIVVIAIYTFYLNGRIGVLTQQRDRLKNVEKEVRVIKAKLREVKLMTTIVRNLEKGRGEAYRTLKNIADVMPKGLWLTRVVKKNEILKIEGKSFTTEAIAQYMTNLGNLKNVVKVNFDSRGLVREPSKSGTDIYKFYISIVLKG